jgi:predicted ABC-type ATPase
MAKMIILSGIPGSGKSTWTKDFIKDNDNYFVVSRDSIRFMKDKYWRPKDERFVEKAEKLLAETAIEYGFNVIIDDTNLYPEKWIEVAKLNGMEYEVKYFDIDLRTAIDRVTERRNAGGHYVDIQTMVNFHTRYQKINEARLSNQS